MSEFSPPSPPMSVPSSAKPKKPFYKRTWFLVIAGLTLIGIFSPKSDSTKSDSSVKSTSTTDSTTSTTTIPEKMWNENLKSDVIAADLALTTCSELKKVIKSQTKLIASRISATEKPSSDPYDSADYIAEIDWETTIHTDDLSDQMRAATAPVLTNGSMAVPSVSQYIGFVGDAIIACGLTQDSSALDDSAFKLDQRLLNMKSASNNLPWYPKGFNEYSGDSRIAWRWLDRGEYSCSYGDHCWGMAIIAREGCPASVYAEITILDSSDANIGFTNDATSGLGAGQKAKLVFEDFTAGAKSARLAKISCY